MGCTEIDWDLEAIPMDYAKVLESVLEDVVGCQELRISLAQPDSCS